MRSKFTALLCAAFVAGLTSFPMAADTAGKAADKNDPKQFTIDESSIKTSVQEITPESGVQLPQRSSFAVDLNGLADTPKEGLADDLNVLDQIVNLTTKVWGIIKDNKPVVDIHNQYATAVPDGIKSWTKLTGWQGPKGYVYTFSAKNLYGITTVDVKYMVTYSYSGAYKGKGHYLTGVTVEPLAVDVLWGYTFNISAEVPDSTIVNVGSETDPMAALQLVLKWQISTALKSSQGRSINYIRGDGYFKELGDWSKAKDPSKLSTMKEVPGSSSTLKLPVPEAK